jgi:hypothetical protein
MDTGESITIGDFTVDRNGIGDTWRVWWIGPDEYSYERSFSTREAAIRWAKETHFLLSPT